ncbi:hypothetical protein C8Q80DRAFT_1272345 [Daedaleopsis nitida]|nr:hypothetical protein C8Q80DRAFT_1272345 [Daedaleopsis nitida]
MAPAHVTCTPSTRVAPAKAAPTKAAQAKAKPAPTCAKAPAKAKSAAAHARKAEPEPEEAPSPKAAARGDSRAKKVLTPAVIEDEAEREEEDNNGEDDAEECSGHDITSDDGGTISVVSVVDDENEYDFVKPVKEEPPCRKAALARARKAPTPQSPKIRRSLKPGEVPVSQESPSPRKPSGAAKKKPAFAVTPANMPSKKRAKESYSDEDSEEDASPTKKVRGNTPSSNDDDDVQMVDNVVAIKRNTRGVEMVDKVVQTPPLPRINGAIKARAKAPVCGTPRKAKTTAKGPDSAETFFNPSDVDRSFEKYRLQAKLFTHATDKSAQGNGAQVTEAVQDVRIEEPNLNGGILDFETPGALCHALAESYKSLPVLQACTIDTGSSILSSALLHDHIIDGPYDVHPKVLEMLVKFSHDKKADNPFVINPARADPAKAIAYQYPNWKAVVCLCSYIIEPMQMSMTPTYMIKE